jgi:hypothetical protein
MFQKYAAITAAWVTVPLVGVACMPSTVADAVVCACGHAKAEEARVVPAAWASKPFSPQACDRGGSRATSIRPSASPSLCLNT